VHGIVYSDAASKNDKLKFITLWIEVLRSKKRKGALLQPHSFICTFIQETQEIALVCMKRNAKGQKLAQ
jgi:hypothetical protein